MTIIEAYLIYCVENDMPIPDDLVLAKISSNDNLLNLEPTDKNIARIDRIITSLMIVVDNKQSSGHGYDFDNFCIARGRKRPKKDVIDLLNINPFKGAQAIRLDPKSQLLYRSYVTFKTHGGTRNV